MTSLDQSRYDYSANKKHHMVKALNKDRASAEKTPAPKDQPPLAQTKMPIRGADHATAPTQPKKQQKPNKKTPQQKQNFAIFEYPAHSNI